MNNEPDIQQYKNLIVLLKNILEFYGDMEKYNPLDEGHQARYALGLIDNIQSHDYGIEQYINDFGRINGVDSINEELVGAMKIIEKIKNYKDIK